MKMQNNVKSKCIKRNELQSRSDQICKTNVTVANMSCFDEIEDGVTIDMYLF